MVDHNVYVNVIGKLQGMNKLKMGAEDLKMFTKRSMEQANTMRTANIMAKAMTKSYKDLTDKQRKISAGRGLAQVMQEKQQRTAEGMGFTLGNFRRGLEKENIAWRKNGRFWDVSRKRYIKHNELQKRLTLSMKRFKMELLSVMFFGMAVEKTMFGLMQASLQASGFFDVWSAILTTTFLPVAMAATNMLFKLWNAINSVPGLKPILNVAVPILGIGGAALSTWAMLGIAFAGMEKAAAGWSIFFATKFGASIAATWGTFTAWIASAWAGFTGALAAGWEWFIGLGAGTIGTIIAAIVGLAVAIALVVKNWDDFTRGISIWAHAILNPIEYITKFIDKIKEMGGVVEALKMLLSPLAELFGAKAYVPKGWSTQGIDMTPKQQAGDFIWRAGEGMTQISPKDTLVGSQGGNAASGGIIISPTINFNNPIISNNVNARDFAKQVLDVLYVDLRRLGVR